MTTLNIEKLNEVHLRFYCDDMGVEAEFVDYFTYEYPGAKFTPKYRARLWDGKVRLADPIRKTIYVGLLDYIIKFAESRGYTLNLPDIPLPNITSKEIEEYTSSLNLQGRDQPLQVRDYQIDAITNGLANNRAVLLSPTGSGKSLIIYTICRWHIDQGRKIIVVVPTTSLVEQMYSDFQDYSSANQWNVDEHCQKLYSGFPKHFEKDILFTTWQSAYGMPKPWFQQFNVVVGDECHLFKAKSLITIMERLSNVAYRIGTTGSLDDKKINRLVLEGIFGKLYKVTSTKKLQSDGKLSPLKIRALILKYPESARKLLNKADYQKEIEFLVLNPKRNNFICNLAASCKGNTLLLFQFVEKHGSVLYDILKSRNLDQPVYFIHGGTDVNEREHIRKSLDSNTGAIIIASYGVFSTGVNIPSIENIIFSSPSKSRVRNLQSIGRGLRLNNGKTHCTLYDITDDLHWKSWKNHTLKHGAERYKLYAEEEFPINLIEVDIGE